jgi:hypothetical protein
MLRGAVYDFQASLRRPIGKREASPHAAALVAGAVLSVEKTKEPHVRQAHPYPHLGECRQGVGVRNIQNGTKNSGCSSLIKKNLAKMTFI